MRPILLRLAVASASLVLCASSFAQADGRGATPNQAARFDAAMQAYEIQHFQQAYDGLVGLAEEGHAEAARIALLMTRYGRELYGTDWKASTAQRQSWTRVALASR